MNSKRVFRWQSHAEFLASIEANFKAAWPFFDRRPVLEDKVLETPSFSLVFSDYLFHLPGAFRGDSSFVQELTPNIGGGRNIERRGLEAVRCDHSRDFDRLFLGRDGFPGKSRIGVGEDAEE